MKKLFGMVFLVTALFAGSLSAAGAEEPCRSVLQEYRPTSKTACELTFSEYDFTGSQWVEVGTEEVYNEYYNEYYEEVVHEVRMNLGTHLELDESGEVAKIWIIQTNLLHEDDGFGQMLRRAYYHAGGYNSDFWPENSITFFTGTAKVTASQEANGIMVYFVTVEVSKSATQRW